MSQKPAVFVSSTCYDLGAIRHELNKFIADLGYQPYLSELSSFPINPSSTTVENCVQNVREHAEIFVLVIGTRYGSTDERGKSVTNLEYTQARTKRIPIYAFVQSDALAQLPVWSANPTAVFPGVDSTKVFEFISQVRSTDSVWTFPFQNVEDIKSALREQWAFLFHDSLKLRQRCCAANLPASLSSLTGDALRFVIDRPDFWEYRLFSSMLDKVFDDARPKRFDWELGLSLGPIQVVDNDEALGMLQTKNENLMQLMEVFGRLFSSSIQEAAFGPKGVPGDPERVVHFARRVGDLYISLLDWSLEVRRVRATEVMRPLFEHVSTGINTVIAEFDEFRKAFSEQIADLVRNPPKQGETRVIKTELVLELPPDFLESHERILKDVARKLGLSDY